MHFEDGASPPYDIITEWNNLVMKTFYSKTPPDAVPECIAIHCVAGLGR
jgi:hypothetical protein